MTETEQILSLQEEASRAWKIGTYLLLFTVLSFMVSAVSRIMIGTFMIANSTGTSLYQFICLPTSIFLTPFIIFWLPFIMVRNANKSESRNLIVMSLALIGVIIAITVFSPGWAKVLWGISL